MTARATLVLYTNDRGGACEVARANLAKAMCRYAPGEVELRVRNLDRVERDEIDRAIVVVPTLAMIRPTLAFLIGTLEPAEVISFLREHAQVEPRR